MAIIEKEGCVQVELVIGVPIVAGELASVQLNKLRLLTLEIESLVQDYGGTVVVGEVNFA